MIRLLIRLLGNLTIGMKLTLLSGVAMAGFAVVIGLLVFRDAAMSDTRAIEERRNERIGRLADLALDSATLRLIERDFSRRRDGALVGEFDRQSRQILAVVATLRTAAAPELQNQYAILADGLGGYAGTFAAYAKTAVEMGLTQNDGLQGRMRTAVRAAEAELARLNQDRITVSILQLRRNEKDFQLRETQEDVQAHARQMGVLRELLRTAGLPEDRASELTRLADAYAASFRDLVAGTERRAQFAERMKREFDALEPLIDAIEKAELESAGRIAALVRARMEFLQYLTFALCAVVVAVVATLSLLIAAAVSRPLKQMIEQMDKLGAGDADISVSGTGKDEVAGIGRALLVFRDNLVKQRALETEAARAAEGDLERAKRISALVARFRGETADLIGASQRASASLSATAGGLARLSDAAVEMATGAASGANEASSSVQTVASATEELAASIEEISRQVSLSNAAAARTEDLARNNERTVRDLTDAAERIGNVVTLINTIAAQTNLLALNATIEAARAGDAGKGFAIVASEVKNLATQTSKATEEIAGQVAAIQRGTGGVAAGISDIGAAIRDISQMTTAVSAAVEEQAAATREIGRNVEQAARGVEGTNKAIDGARGGAERTLAAAKEIRESSDSVEIQTRKMGERISNFLEAVQAA
jgi:methyl-accepting chemotaxis protein